MRMYRVEHDGVRDRVTLKQYLKEHREDYKLPCLITLGAPGAESEYYVEESNVGGGGLLVIDRRNVWSG